MRHALITTHLLRQARDAAIAQAEADERLEHQAGMLPRAQPVEPGRLARVVPWPAASVPWRHGPPDRRQVNSNEPQVRRYQRIDRQTPRFEAIHFDRFPGGCVTTQAAAPAVNRAEVTGDLATILHYTTRQALQQALNQRSDGRLRLDPLTA